MNEFMEHEFMEPYEVYVMKLIKSKADAVGGLRELSRQIGVDNATLSKIMLGRFIPSAKTLKRWFPELDISTVQYVVDFNRLREENQK
jgi:transcriptional regulator with XRE-family HTH domain